MQIIDSPYASKEVQVKLGRIPKRLIHDFTRDLSIMLGARMRLLHALKILQGQTRHKAFAQLLNSLQLQLNSGKSFAEGLQGAGSIFNGFFINMVLVGETTGRLSEMLSRVSEYQEKIADLQRKLIQALTYPALVIGVAAAAMSFILLYVLPTFEGLFQEFDAELPAITRGVMRASNLLQTYTLPLLGLLLLISMALYFFRENPGFISLRDRLYLRLPFFGNLVRKNYLAQFCRTLGTLLESGIPLLRALEVASRITPNIHFRNEVIKMTEATAKGSALALSLDSAGIFPDMVIQMISVGEETAELPAMLIKVAQIYDGELDRTIELMSTLIEPVMILFLGVLIGAILIAIYLPLFNMSSIMPG